jgi:membrane-bound lytic murein transglycosylase F
MHSRILCGMALVAFALAGCTPYGDGALKRDVAGNENSVAGVSEKAGLEKESSRTLIDPTTGGIVRSYGPVIKQYATHYGMDWRLVLATMKQESGFMPEAKSRRGAAGLMQIMPTTGDELAKELEVGDISDPQQNIRGGIHYLRRLYDLFPGAEEADRLKLALAAYNAGIGRIYDAQEIAAYLHQNPLAWASIKDALPLLSRRHSLLHRSVWSQNRPKSGWFGDPGQTVKYVENVMNNYEEYRLLFN